MLPPSRRHSAVEHLILQELEAGPPRTRGQLAERAGLPLTTVVSAANRLLARADIIELGPPAHEQGRLGRPARRLTVPGRHGDVVALTMSRQTMRAAVVGFDGTIRASAARAFDPNLAIDGFIDPGLELLEAALHGSDVSTSSIVGGVVGIPAPLRPGPGEHGSRTMTPELKWRRGYTNLPTWMSQDPAVQLSRALEVHCLAENDANLAAVGEAVFGAGIPYASLIHIKISDGIGAGVIIDDRLVRGVAGFAGEIAHLHVNADGPLCVCGRRGCLGLMTNAVHLLEMAKPAYGDDVTFDDLVRLSGEKEAGVTLLMEDLGRSLGASLASACVLINPAAVIVDARLGPAARLVGAGIREILDRQVPAPIANSIDILPGTLGADAETLGAAALAAAPSGAFVKTRRARTAKPS